MTNGSVQAFFNFILRDLGAKDVQIQEVLCMDDELIRQIPYVYDSLTEEVSLKERRANATQKARPRAHLPIPICV